MQASELLEVIGECILGKDISIREFGEPNRLDKVVNVKLSEDSLFLEIVCSSRKYAYAVEQISDFEDTTGGLEFMHGESRVTITWTHPYTDNILATRGYEQLFEDTIMPVRSTKYASGTDIFAYADTIIEPNARVLVPTGLTAYMLEDEELILDCRSGMPKLGLHLANDRGTIDCDFYGRHIHVYLHNYTSESILVERGQRIAQGKFYKVLRPDNEQASNQVRTGGFHSTGK